MIITLHLQISDSLPMKMERERDVKAKNFLQIGVTVKYMCSYSFNEYYYHAH